jgi:hypothetical protein
MKREPKAIREAETRGYLRTLRRANRLYLRWYDRCAASRRPFIAWQGNCLRIDLLTSDIRLTESEAQAIEKRWRNAICREPAHRRRCVWAVQGTIGGDWEVCSHMIQPFAAEIIELILSKQEAHEPSGGRGSRMGHVLTCVNKFGRRLRQPLKAQ